MALHRKRPEVLLTPRGALNRAVWAALSRKQRMPAPPEKGKAIVPNVLPRETRVRIIGALTEGNSIRATSRLTGISKGAVMALAIRVGDGCAHLHNRLARGLAAYDVECDETWSFIAKKEARCDPAKDPLEWGDVYTFLAIDAITKLAISFAVGKRNQATTDSFIADLRSRLTVVPYITTDGFQPYVSAVGASFMGSADYGQVQKNYSRGAQRGPDHRYEPPRDPFITRTPVQGSPLVETMNTVHVERLNLTMRHTVGRTRRLCLAFSKTLRGHRAAMALGITAYNFCRKNLALGGDRTPAMAAKLTDHPWTMPELVDAALEAEPEAPPTPVRLVLRPGTTGARELPNGRGFLRVVGRASSSGPDAPPAEPSPAAPAPAMPLEPVAPEADPTGQLDLLVWVRPPEKPRAPVQLDLFPRE